MYAEPYKDARQNLRFDLSGLGLDPLPEDFLNLSWGQAYKIGSDIL